MCYCPRRMSRLARRDRSWALASALLGPALIVACSSASNGGAPAPAADASIDATSTSVSIAVATDAAPPDDANDSGDDDAGDDADTCATARADYNTLLKTTRCGQCLTSQCSAFVANTDTECSTINASLALFDCEMVSTSHECAMLPVLGAFDSLELKQLYTCGTLCGDTCQLGGPPPSDAGADADADAAVDAALDASDASDASDAGD